VSLAFSLIRNKIACKVEGRDVGSGLKRLCNRWRVASTAELIDKLNDYATIEKAKALAKKNEGRAQMIDDQVETLKIIIEGANKESKHEIRDVIVSIDSLFSDDVSAKGILTLSTIHKSKGREWNTVFWLNRDTTCPSKYARQKWQLEQEDNLMYVAATRTQDTLIELSDQSTYGATR
jgi:superfamily I DNA/RNA helicase